VKKRGAASHDVSETKGVSDKSRITFKIYVIEIKELVSYRDSASWEKRELKNEGLSHYVIEKKHTKIRHRDIPLYL